MFRVGTKPADEGDTSDVSGTLGGGGKRSDRPDGTGDEPERSRAEHCDWVLQYVMELRVWDVCEFV